VMCPVFSVLLFFFQAEDGIRDRNVTGVQTCALPIFELLLPLTTQLGIGLDDLVAPDVVDPRVRRPAIHRGGMVITPLAPEGAQVATYKITYPPSRTAPEPRVHDGYEWLYVLSGRLRLVLGEQELTRTRGEAAEFDTRVPHSLSAAGSRPAQVISIFNDDGVRMHTHTAQE